LAERMTAERDAFGFYFSAHPVDAHRHLLAAHKVRSFAEVTASPIASEGRTVAMMAGLVEDSRWRTSARGRRYLMATLSDSSGQYVATVFDDEPAAALEAAARSGQCGLVQVELDRRAGDEAPRVTVKRFQPLDSLARSTRLQMTIRVTDAAVVPAIAKELEQVRGRKGMVRLIVPLGSGGEAVMVAGRDFALCAELADRLERMVGEGAVELSAQEPPKLALVG
jgi:DNA polymerase-3 subunit alpha